MIARVVALCVSCLFLVGMVGSPARAAAACSDGLGLTGSVVVPFTGIVGLATPNAPQRQDAAAPSPPARPWWGWILLGRMHAMVVHFPIALQYVDRKDKYPPEWWGLDGGVHTRKYL